MKLDPKLKRFLEIGFELEFCHDLTKKEIKEHIGAIIPGDLKWVSASERKHTKRSELGYRNCFTLYHDGTIDVDYGDQSEWELVTPVWQYRQGLNRLFRLLAWIEYSGATTNKTTALHFSLSLKPPFETETIDKIKLIKLVDEERQLKKYRRASNAWCRSHYSYLKSHIDKPTAADMIHADQRDRAISFRRNHYVEFRIIGNKNYHLRWPEIIQTVDRCAYAMIKAAK